MNKESILEPKDWFSTHLPQPNKPRNKLSRDRIQEWLGDFACPFYSPLTPLFSFEISSPEDIADYEIITLRDGIVPLLWFFRKNPDPTIFSCHFLVHYELKDFVPASWRSSVNFYSVASNNQFPVARNKIILTGHFPDQYCDQSEIVTKLEILKEQLNTSKIKHPSCVDIYMPVLHDPFYVSNQGGANVFKFCQESLKMFNRFEKIWSAREFNSVNDLSSYYIYSIDSGMLIADTSNVHAAMKKNAYLLNPTPELKPKFQIELSPYHHINIFEANHPSTSPSKGDQLLKTFNQFYSLESDSNEIEGPLDKRMPAPSHFSFPNSFFNFIRQNYK